MRDAMICCFKDDWATNKTLGNAHTFIAQHSCSYLCTWTTSTWLVANKDWLQCGENCESTSIWKILLHCYTQRVSDNDESVISATHERLRRITTSHVDEKVEFWSSDVEGHTESCVENFRWRHFALVAVGWARKTLRLSANLLEYAPRLFQHVLGQNWSMVGEHLGRKLATNG